MSDWQSKSYGEIATFKKGINYTSSDYGDSNDGLPFITIKCVRKGGGYSARGLKFYKGSFSKSDLLNEGDVIFSITDLTRAADIVGSPLKVPKFDSDKLALASMDMMRIAPVEDICDRAFLYHRMMLEDVRLQMAKYAAGSTVLHLETKKVTEIRFDLPPLDQQQKIAKILSTVDKLIEQTQTLIAKYTAIKQGMMADLFTRGIDMTTDPDNKLKGSKLRPSVEDAPELYKQTELGWVPKEWEVTTLEGEHQIHSGSTPSRQEVERYFKNGNIQWIKTLDLNESEIRMTEEQITELALKESSCRLLPVNTVLIAMYGGWIQIGRTAILKAECATNQAICALIPNCEKLIPEFTMYYLQHFKDVWKKVAISTRKDPNITKSDVNEFPYLVPPVMEQKEIVLRIKSINDALKNHIASREKLNKQKKGLMQDLLTGKVKVG